MTFNTTRELTTEEITRNKIWDATHKFIFDGEENRYVVNDASFYELADDDEQLDILLDQFDCSDYTDTMIAKRDYLKKYERELDWFYSECDEIREDLGLDDTLTNFREIAHKFYFELQKENF